MMSFEFSDLFCPEQAKSEGSRGGGYSIAQAVDLTSTRRSDQVLSEILQIQEMNAYMKRLVDKQSINSEKAFNKVRVVLVMM